MNAIHAGHIALALGLLALALLLGALGFEYLGGLAPCEMCMWQRWPHIAAAVIGIGGGGLAVLGKLDDDRLSVSVAILVMMLVALSGAIGVYHAGVEWKWWEGPDACTGHAFVLSGKLDLSAPVVRCDIAQWRFLGVSLAGYNAILSLGLSAIAGIALIRARRT